jgi:hypothetical protein
VKKKRRLNEKKKDGCYRNKQKITSLSEDERFKIKTMHQQRINYNEFRKKLIDKKF